MKVLALGPCFHKGQCRTSLDLECDSALYECHSAAVLCLLFDGYEIITHADTCLHGIWPLVNFVAGRVTDWVKASLLSCRRACGKRPAVDSTCPNQN
jgi:hypothetical protein